MSTHEADLAHKIEDAKVKFEQYAEAYKHFQIPQAHIQFEAESDEATKVHMEILFNGTQYYFESMDEKYIDDIHTYLNSQSLVRAKYADGKTTTRESTAARVHTFVDRFRNKTSPLYLYSGFVVSDPQTDTFLGVVNLGGGVEVGTTEMARLNRSEFWSRPPDTLSNYSVAAMPNGDRKTYSGIGTAETCALLQYAAQLKQRGSQVNGHLLKAVVAFARVDNEGSWKSNAKCGMMLDNVDVNHTYGLELRYRLRKNL